MLNIKFPIDKMSKICYTIIIEQGKVHKTRKGYVLRRKERFIVLDVEGLQGLKPYDVGYIISDKEGKIYKKHSFCLVGNLFMNAAECKSTVEQARVMTVRNILAISEDFERKKKFQKWKPISNTTFKKLLLHEIKRYNVTAIYAFNVNFDKAMLRNVFGGEFEDLTEKVEFRDIQTAILMTRLLCEKYLDFCYKNNFRTEKGYPQCKAETVYRYLTNTLTFEEAHTGLEDCEIELQILLSAIRSKKKLEYAGHIAWRELNNLAKTLNHPIYVGRSK